MNEVLLNKVKKDLKKLPSHIISKLHRWIELVELFGINEIRKIPGFHDESLKGIRRGQRSIRLSKSYRAIYIQKVNGRIMLIIIVEIHKHKY